MKVTKKSIATEYNITLTAEEFKAVRLAIGYGHGCIFSDKKTAIVKNVLDLMNKI